MASFLHTLTGQGVVDVRLTPPAGLVGRNSVVLASATEFDFDGAGERPFQGAASIQVLNIVPQDDGTVNCRLNILHEGDLRVRISYEVVGV